MIKIKPAEKSGRGGARVGAGRKPSHEKPRLEAGWYVYAVGEVDSSQFLKIGIAHNPYARLASAQTSNPRTLRFVRLWAIGSSDTYMAVERFLHRALRPFHERGEWFEVAPPDVDRRVADAAEAFSIDLKRVL